MAWCMSLKAISSFNKRIWHGIHSPSSFKKLQMANLSGKPLKNTDLIWEQHKDLYETSLAFNIISFNMLAPCYKRLPQQESSSSMMRKRA